MRICERAADSEPRSLNVQDAQVGAHAQVSLMGDEEYPASVVGVDRDKDVAVLQLKMPEDIDKTVCIDPCLPCTLPCPHILSVLSPA